MSSGVVARRGKARRIPIHRTLPRFATDPYAVLDEVGQEAGGEVVRLDLGLFRPYLLTHPDHVQRVLRDNSDNYIRGGRFWRPLRHLFGDGILGEDGNGWEHSRRTLQPSFTRKYLDSLLIRIGEAVGTAVAELEDAARSGAPLDVSEEMRRIVSHTAVDVLFADQISAADARRVVEAVDTIGTSVVLRMSLGVAAKAIPVPGDRAYWRAVRTVDEVMVPLVRHAQRGPSDGTDILGILSRARAEDGSELTDAQVRDDIVAMFVTANETTSVMLTWLWPVLQAHPEVARRLYDEVDRVVRGGSVRHAEVAELHYTQAVLDELLRLYPAAWIFTRLVRRPDVVGDVLIKGGSTVLLSPYITHKLPQFWDQADVFDPERFLAGRRNRLHRYAYFPFGGGPHQCIGKYFYQLKALVIVATILSRYRPALDGGGIPKPAVAASLRPGRRIEMTLSPVQRRLAA